MKHFTDEQVLEFIEKILKMYKYNAKEAHLVLADYSKSNQLTYTQHDMIQSAMVYGKV